MIIKPKQLQQYLENNRGKKIPGEDFIFEINPPKEDEEYFPYSIRFRSPKWSEKTVRHIGPKNIVRFLDIFNSKNYAKPSDYKNLGTEESDSRSGSYLVKLLHVMTKEIADS